MSTASTARIFNFSAGPAALPLPVLEQAQRDLVSLPGVGMSVMEISHRSKAFEAILDTAIADIRALAGVSADYTIMMLQGGASLQFSMVPMNLLAPGAHRRLHRHRLVGREGGEGGRARRQGERHRIDQGRQLQPRCRSRARSR